MMLLVDNMEVFIYGKEDEGEKQHHRAYSSWENRWVREEGTAAVFKLDQEDLELLKTMIKGAGTCWAE